jgi:hypothetical protein
MGYRGALFTPHCCLYPLCLFVLLGFQREIQELTTELMRSRSLTDDLERALNFKTEELVVALARVSQLEAEVPALIETPTLTETPALIPAPAMRRSRTAKKRTHHGFLGRTRRMSAGLAAAAAPAAAASDFLDDSMKIDDSIDFDMLHNAHKLHSANDRHCGRTRYCGLAAAVAATHREAQLEAQLDGAMSREHKFLAQFSAPPEPEHKFLPHFEAPSEPWAPLSYAAELVNDVTLPDHLAILTDESTDKVRGCPPVSFWIVVPVSRACQYTSA